jgi:hypothetical protein
MNNAISLIALGCAVATGVCILVIVGSAISIRTDANRDRSLETIYQAAQPLLDSRPDGEYVGVALNRRNQRWRVTDGTYPTKDAAIAAAINLGFLKIGLCFVHGYSIVRYRETIKIAGLHDGLETERSRIGAASQAV